VPIDKKEVRFSQGIPLLAGSGLLMLSQGLSLALRLSQIDIIFLIIVC